VRGLELLAGAVAGRSVPLERARHGVHSDGATIFLGSEVSPDAEDTWRAVVAQSALIAAGSLQPDRMRRLSRSGPVSSRRYLGLEVVRSSSQLDHLLPTRFRADLAEYAARLAVTSSADESLSQALGHSPLVDPPSWFGRLDPSAVLRSTGRVAADRLSDRDLAEAVRKAVEDPADEQQDADEQGERSRLMEALSSPIKNPLGTALQRMLGMRRSAGQEPGGAELGIVERRSGSSTGRAQIQLPHSSVIRVGGQLASGAAYPEWDCHKLRYREDWCRVGEFDPPRVSGLAAPGVAADPALRRELSRLGLTWRPHDGESLGDELDLTALVDHRVSLAAGGAAEPRVYRAERRTAQELGVLVLLDATGSAAEQSGRSGRSGRSGQYEGRSMFDEQRDLALGLTSTLDQLGVRVATYAFYSRGRDNVRFLRCKSFEERWAVRAQGRLLGIEPSGFTRLGAAVRHGSHLVNTQAGTQRRLLIVVSDGIAYDDGYEGQYAVADSRRAIDEASARAIGCVGLSTRPTTEDASVWPPDAHRVAANTRELAQVARDLLGGALLTASRPSTVRS
jgi:nitric oxide reductase activation protein